jgi:nicotinamidase/pyrazinamidase
MGNNSSIQIQPTFNINGQQVNNNFAIGCIDVQNDFCKGGSLAVEGANECIADINKLIFGLHRNVEIFHSQDYHPPNHISFASSHEGKKIHEDLILRLKMEDDTFIDVNQKLWPTHCVKDSYGSDFHHTLIITKHDKIIRKGTKENVESYSAFGDEFNGKFEKTELNDWLKSKNITDIIVVGLATDYCVYNTVLDSIRLGYKVHLIMSCTRGVAKDSTEKAINDMKEKGVIFYSDVDKFYARYKQVLTYG